MVDGVKERLVQLSKVVDIHIVSADTHATAKKHLGDLPITIHILKTEQQDCKKREYLEKLVPAHVAAMGNGHNDRLLLQETKENRGLSIAVH